MEPEVTVTSDLDAGLTPVQQAILQDSSSRQEYELPRSKRKIVFKEPDGMASYNIAKMMGSESMNPVLTIFYNVAMCVDSIDGQPVKTPRTALEVEALIARLAKTNEWDDTVMLFNRWNGIGPDGRPLESEERTDTAKK